MKRNLSSAKVLILGLLFLSIFYEAKTQECGEESKPPIQLPMYQGNQKFNVSDRYGNQYTYGEIKIDYGNSNGGNGNTSSNDPIPSALPFQTNPAPCVAGMFTIHFAPDATGYGFDDAANRAVVCQVFKDISVLIEDVNPSNGGRVNIWVASDVTLASLNPSAMWTNVAGQASAFRAYPNGLNNVILDNAVARTIKGGKNCYLNLPLNIVPPYTDKFFHGYLAINFKTFSWYNDYTTTAGIGTNDRDLYSTVLHEALHLLGIASLVQRNGSSKLANNIYSLIDPYFTIGNSSIRIINYLPTPRLWQSAGVSLENGCGNPSSIIFNGVNLTAAEVYTNHSNPAIGWSSGSSLSHLSCNNSFACSGYATTSTPPNDYSMAFCRRGGADYIKRRPNFDEVKLLCDLHYSLKNQSGVYAYGDDSTNSSIYQTYNNCSVNSCYAVGYADSTFSGLAGAPIAVPTSKILSNDYNGNIVDTSDIKIVPAGAGTITFNGSDIIFTPSANYIGEVIIGYYPKCSQNGIRGSMSFFFINVKHPPLSPCVNTGQCNLVCGGDFEEGNTAFPYCDLTTARWGNTVDIFRTDNGITCSRNSWYPSLYGGLSQPHWCNTNWGCDISTASLQAPQGKQFIGMASSDLPIDRESFLLKLNTNLIPGNTYKFSVLARKVKDTCQKIPVLRVYGDSIPPCPRSRNLSTSLAATTTTNGTTDACGFSAKYLGKVSITTGTWVKYDFTFSPATKIAHIVASLEENTSTLDGLWGVYAFIDSVEIVKTNVQKLKIVATTDTVRPCNGESFRDTFIVCLDTSAVGSNTDTIKLKLTLPQGISVLGGSSFNANGEFNILPGTISKTTCANLILVGKLDQNYLTSNYPYKIYLKAINNNYCLPSAALNTITVIPASNLNVSITKSVSKKYPKVGDTISYTVEICNYELSTLTGLTIRDTIPPGLSIVKTSGYTINGNILSKTITLPQDNCILDTYQVIVTNNQPKTNCVYLKSNTIPCLKQSSCVSINDELEFCANRIGILRSPFITYTVKPNSSFNVVKKVNDSIYLKFNTLGKMSVIVDSGVVSDTIPINVYSPQPYIAVTESKLCDPKFKPTGDNTNGLIISGTGLCQNVCEGSCVKYIAGGKSNYNGRTFKWMVDGATNYTSNDVIIGNEITICWGNQPYGNITLIEVSNDSCTDTTRACVNVILNVGNANFGILPDTGLTSYSVCQYQDLVFRDFSTIRSYPDIESWCWDMGDGNSYCGNVLQDGLPSVSFNHSYDKLGTFNVKLTYTTKCGCIATLTKQVIVDSGQVMTIYCKNPVCHGDTVEYYVDSICPPPYNWTVTNGMIIGSNNNARVWVVWGDPSDGIGYISIDAPPGCPFCNGTQTLKISILPSNPTITYPISACAGDQVTHTSIEMSSTKYVWKDWTFSNSFDSIYYHNYIIPSSTVAGRNFAMYMHSMILYNKYGQVRCSNQILYQTQILDTFHWTGPDTACINDGSTYSMSILKPADTIEVSGGNPFSTQYFFGTNSVSINFPNGGVFKIVAKDVLLCPKGDCTKTVFVPTVETPTMIIGDTVICPNSVQTYNALTKVKGQKFNWITTSDMQIMGSSQDQIQIKFTSVGIHRLGVVNTQISYPYCSSDTIWLDVNCTPVQGQLIGAKTSCSNESTLFYLTDSTGYNYQWTIIPSGLSAIQKLSDHRVYVRWNDFNSTTRFTVKVDFKKCGIDTSLTDTILVKVEPNPIITGNDTVCVGTAFPYNCSTTSTSSPAFYSWTGTGFTVSSQSKNPNLTFNQSGKYTINLATRTGSCSQLKIAKKEVLALPLPRTEVTMVPSAFTCKGQHPDSPYTAQGTIAIIGNGRYRITNPIGTALPAFTKTFTGGTWSSQYTVYDSLTKCSVQIPVSVTQCPVNPKENCPPADPGDSIVLYRNSNCGSMGYYIQPFGGPYIKYNVSHSGNITTEGQNAVVENLAPGIYEFIARAYYTDKCFVHKNFTDTIKLQPLLDVSVICENNQRKLLLRDKSAYIEPYKILNRSWRVLKGSTVVGIGAGPDFKTVGLNAGNYSISLTVTNNVGTVCTISETISIDSFRASFIIDTTTICSGGSVNFTSTSTDTAKIIEYRWRPSSLSSHKGGVKTFAQYFYTSSFFNIPQNPGPRLEITDNLGCTHLSAAGLVNVYSSPFTTLPKINLSSNNICSNLAPISAWVTTPTSLRAPYLFKWNDKAESITNPVSLQQSGTYHVRMQDKYGCVAYTNDTPVTIALSPIIEMEGKEKICLGQTIDIQYDAGMDTLDIQPSTWVTNNRVIHQPILPGNYTIVATAKNALGCTDTLITPIQVDSPATVSIGQKLIQCKPYTIELKGTGSQLPQSPISAAYLWAHGPNTVTTNVRQGGIYTLRYTNENGCIALDSIYVPKALRFLNFPEGCFEVCQDPTNSVPVVFRLEWDRPAYESWEWYRNDVVLTSGINSLPTNPLTINYPTAGSFKYHLKISANGCTITSPPVYIIVHPQPCIFMKMANGSNAVSNQIKNQWNLYPSPADDKLYISSNFNIEDKEIIVYSITGVEMYRGKYSGNALDVKRYAQGVYLVQLREQGMILDKKQFVIIRDK